MQNFREVQICQRDLLSEKTKNKQTEKNFHKAFDIVSPGDEQVYRGLERYSEERWPQVRWLSKAKRKMSVFKGWF